LHFGTYYPEKGMHEISQSIYRLAQRQGVKFHLGEPVQRISMSDSTTASGLQTTKANYDFDIVVSNMDVVPTYRKLLPNLKAPERILNQERSSSALIFYWGIRKRFDQLDLHNIFFSDHYQQEFDAIFNAKTLHDDPTVYVNITSKHTAEDAPAGCENWFVMINVPGNYGQDWDELINKSRERILAKLSRILGESIKDLIEVEHVLDPRGIEKTTQSFRGALYGAASNSQFAAFLRHPNHRKALTNVYFCGGSAHPGGGIPLCLQSGKIVSELITHDRRT
jgi:phytoene desaturase